MHINPILPSILIMNVTACMKSPGGSESVVGSRKDKVIQQPASTETRLAGKEILVSTTAGVKMKITWGVAGSETLGNVTTTSYRLSPFQVEVIDLKDPNSEVKVTLRNKLKVQNLSNGIWQLGITKQYLVPLVRSGNIYQGSLDDDGIAVTDEAGGSELPMNSSLRPIQMEHSQQLH